MKYVVLSNRTEPIIRAKYFSELRLFLSILEYDYPFFTSWLDKVFLELNSPKRKIILCLSNDDIHIYGVAILKDTQDEKKICTIRVERAYQNLGIGTVLVKMAQEILNCEKPLITVSEKLICDFLPFLRKFDFKLVSKVKSLYLEGHYEYFFNKEYSHTNILLSIKPQYANAIFSGDKSVEFRKKIANSTVERVFVYSSFPCKVIIGFFDIARVIKNSPKELWVNFGYKGCITKEAFDRYFSNADTGYAIVISNVYKYSIPLDPNEYFENFRAPQNFSYIDNVQILNKLLTRKLLK